MSDDEDVDLDFLRGQISGLIHILLAFIVLYGKSDAIISMVANFEDAPDMEGQSVTHKQGRQSIIALIETAASARKSAEKTHTKPAKGH